MKITSAFLLLFIFFLAIPVAAQIPVVGSPIRLDLGAGGGVTIPNGKYADRNEAGYHFSGKARMYGFMPLKVQASADYSRLSNKIGGEKDLVWVIGAGLEYPVPSVMVEPYFGLDATVNILDNTAQGASADTRYGLGLGAGANFTIPMLGSFDTSVKYQVLNLLGKKDGEETYSQIVGTVVLMFTIL